MTNWNHTTMRDKATTGCTRSGASSLQSEPRDQTVLKARIVHIIRKIDEDCSAVVARSTASGFYHAVFAFNICIC